MQFFSISDVLKRSFKYTKISRLHTTLCDFSSDIRIFTYVKERCHSSKVKSLWSVAVLQAKLVKRLLKVENEAKTLFPWVIKMTSAKFTPSAGSPPENKLIKNVFCSLKFMHDSQAPPFFPNVVISVWACFCCSYGLSLSSECVKLPGTTVIKISICWMYLAETWRHLKGVIYCIILFP